MGSIGTGEILLVFLIALLLFGPGKLPELGRALGRAVREFKKAETQVKEALSGGAETPSDDTLDKAGPMTAEPDPPTAKKQDHE